MPGRGKLSGWKSNIDLFVVTGDGVECVDTVEDSKGRGG